MRAHRRDGLGGGLKLHVRPRAQRRHALTLQAGRLLQGAPGLPIAPVELRRRVHVAAVAQHARRGRGDERRADPCLPRSRWHGKGRSGGLRHDGAGRGAPLPQGLRSRGRTRQDGHQEPPVAEPAGLQEDDDDAGAPRRVRRGARQEGPHGIRAHRRDRRDHRSQEPRVQQRAPRRRHADARRRSQGGSRRGQDRRGKAGPGHPARQPQAPRVRRGRRRAAARRGERAVLRDPGRRSDGDARASRRTCVGRTATPRSRACRRPP